MVNYTKPELEIQEFELIDILTVSVQTDKPDADYGEWY